MVLRNISAAQCRKRRGREGRRAVGSVLHTEPYVVHRPGKSEALLALRVNHQWSNL